MILENKVADVIIVGSTEVKKATINSDKMAKLQYLLTKGLYKEPITAVIAEWTNNAVDSVVQSGKDPIENPVIVAITKNDQGQYIFSVEDTGLGLNADDFENICMNYLTSTKEDDNGTLGAFGIGMKSFLALERSATFTCRKDGVERKYIAFEGEEFVNYDLIYEQPTTESNGVRCELVIKDWNERSEFVQKGTQKLAYYDTAVFIVDGKIIENKITRSKNWQHSNNNKNPSIHLCLKDVYYPIDWVALGMGVIEIPIALRFSLEDGITPTPSRESYITNEKTKALIIGKLKEVAEEFLNTYNESVKSFPNLYDAYQHINNPPKITIADRKFAIRDILKPFNLIENNATIDGTKFYDSNFYKRSMTDFCSRMKVVMEMQYGGLNKRYVRSMETHMREFDYSPYNCERRKLVTFNFDLFKGYARRFVLESLGNDALIFDIHPNWRKLEDYKRMLWLRRYPKSEWRARIQEYQKVEQGLIDKVEFIDLSENNPKLVQWIEEQRARLKENRKLNPPTYKGLNKKEGEMTISYARMSGKDNSEIVYVKKTVEIAKLDEVNSLNVLIDKDITVFQKRIVLANRNNYLNFVKIGPREINNIKDCKKFITFSKFMETKPFSRLVTAILFNELLEEYRDIKFEVAKIKPLTKYAEAISTLNGYVMENLDTRSTLTEAFTTEMLKMAKENNLFDKRFWAEYTLIQDFVDKYDFLSVLKSPSYRDPKLEEKIKKVITKMLLFQKLHNNSEEFVFTAIENVVVKDELLAGEDEVLQEALDNEIFDEAV